MTKSQSYKDLEREVDLAIKSLVSGEYNHSKSEKLKIQKLVEKSMDLLAKRGSVLQQIK